MDSIKERAIGSLTQRHEDKIKQLAESIQEEIGYVLARIASGNTASAGHYMTSIATDAQEISRRIFALEAIGDVTGIVDASED